MKLTLMAAAAAAVLACAAPAVAQPAAPGAPQSSGAPRSSGAKAFIEQAETELAAMNEYANRAQWVRANFITEDTQWIEAKVNGEQKELFTRLAKEAAKFDAAQADPATARKLKLLKLYLSLPAPDRPGAAAEVAGLATKLDSIYSTGKFQHGGKTLTLNDAEDVLAESRDPAELKAVWEGWHSVSPVMKADYAKLATLLNEGARGMGYKDLGALWRGGYDMEPDAFAAEEDRLWKQVEPFYKQLHCYVRARLNERYGDTVQPKTGPIRADLLGNMWAQQWGHIYDVVQPKGVTSSYSLDKLLTDKGYDAVRMVKTGEGFYTSLGLDPLPQTFWERSLITRPRDREVVCHASAWDLDDKSDIRIKMCTKINAEDFQTVHHELGHNFYQRAYADQPFLFKNGANDGFHEAIGDFVGL